MSIATHCTTLVCTVSACFHSIPAIIRPQMTLLHSCSAVLHVLYVHQEPSHPHTLSFIPLPRPHPHPSHPPLIPLPTPSHTHPLPSHPPTHTYPHPHTLPHTYPHPQPPLIPPPTHTLTSPPQEHNCLSLLPVQCPTNLPPHLILEGNAYVNTQATFSCPQGYGLVGNATLQCASDGTWSAGFPQCVEGTSARTAEHLLHVGTMQPNLPIAVIPVVPGLEWPYVWKWLQYGACRV